MRYLSTTKYDHTTEDFKQVYAGKAKMISGSEAVLLDAAMQNAMGCDQKGCKKCCAKEFGLGECQLMRMWMINCMGLDVAKKSRGE